MNIQNFQKNKIWKVQKMLNRKKLMLRMRKRLQVRMWDILLISSKHGRSDKENMHCKRAKKPENNDYENGQ